MASALLQVEDLSKYFSKKSAFGKKEMVAAVDSISFQIPEGQTVGLVGESGSGKSTTGQLIMGLQKPDSGRILYNGKDITAMSKAEQQAFRREVQIIFQNPYDSLNPRMTVKQVIAEPMKIHKMYGSKNELEQAVYQLLREVGLPEEYADRKPHELSGGQCQRVSIARALGLKPKLIVCDEIVSALDVSVQAQVLVLLKELQRQYRMSYLFISHDLSVVRYMCDYLLVMLQGKIVDQGPAEQVLLESSVPYTRQLVASIPKPRQGTGNSNDKTEGSLVS